MKKIIVLGIASLFVLTGCGSKKIVCKGTVSEDGVKYEQKVTATIKDGKVSQASAEMKFEDKDTAEQMCGIFQFANAFIEKEDEKIDFDCDGKTIKIKDFSKFDKDNAVIGKSKADFIKAMEDEELTCK